MSKFTAIAKLMSEDVAYLKDSLYSTRFNLLKKDSYYFAHTFGETKNRNITDELEGELASLGCYPIEIEVFWGV